MGLPQPLHLCCLSNSSEKISFSSPHSGQEQTNDFRCLLLSQPGQCCGVVMATSLSLASPLRPWPAFEFMHIDICRIAMRGEMKKTQSRHRIRSTLTRSADLWCCPRNPACNNYYLKIRMIVCMMDIFQEACPPPIHIHIVRISSCP